MSEISLQVEGKSFLGWKDVEITRRLDALSASFNFSYVSAWESIASLADGWYLKPQDAVEVYIDKDLVLTGYNDQVENSITKDNRIFAVSGRDKTADLIDCSAAVTESKQLRNLNILQIANLLCSPFGIPVVWQTGVSLGEKFRAVSIDYGQSPFEILDSLSRQRGILLTTTRHGSLMLTKAANAARAKIILLEGENILSASLRSNFQNRFSKYTTLGQGKGDAFFFGESARKIKSSATDAAVTRYRPKTFQAERSVTQAEAIKRAQWEAQFQAGRSTTVSVTVNGWRQGPDESDPLWDVNSLVEVFAPSIGISGDLLIESVSMRDNDSDGQITELGLTRPDAWVANPVVKDEQTQFLNIGATS